MKLSQWAKQKGVSYRTAYRYFRNNQIVGAEQLPTGTIVIHEIETLQNPTSINVIYARVSSHDQKNDLVRQVDRLRDYCASRGVTVDMEVSEIASGMNDNRKKLLCILSNKDVGNIIVEHRDRLTRFGFNIIKALLEAQDRNIIVINNTEEKQDLVQDFVDVVTSMCAKIYGRRGSRNRAQRALTAIE